MVSRLEKSLATAETKMAEVETRTAVNIKKHMVAVDVKRRLVKRLVIVVDLERSECRTFKNAREINSLAVGTHKYYEHQHNEYLRVSPFSPNCIFSVDVGIFSLSPSMSGSYTPASKRNRPTEAFFPARFPER